MLLPGVVTTLRKQRVGMSWKCLAEVFGDRRCVRDEQSPPRNEAREGLSLFDAVYPDPAPGR